MATGDVPANGTGKNFAHGADGRGLTDLVSVHDGGANLEHEVSTSSDHRSRPSWSVAQSVI
jgi:hypothetical protein